MSDDAGFRLALQCGAMLLHRFLGWRLLPAIALSIVIGCRPMANRDTGQQLLVILPNASDIRTVGNSVTFQVKDSYPADATRQSLQAALAPKHCLRTEKDPFGADGTGPYGNWFEQTRKTGANERMWFGAWSCQPGGEVIIYGLRTNQTHSLASSDASLEVTGAYYSAEQVAAVNSQIQSARIKTAEPSAIPSSQAMSNEKEALQTCSLCGSTRTKINDGSWTILYASPTVSTCKHQWKDGVDMGTPVKDGAVVLIRRRLTPEAPSYVYGAFKLESQHYASNFTLDYQWVLRTDGSGVMDHTQTAVSAGSAHGQRVSFGPFSVSWSQHDRGSGYVYYPRFPGARRSSDDWQLCVTTLTSFDGIDASDPRFVYKSSPVD